MGRQSRGLSKAESEVIRHFASLEKNTLQIEDILGLFPGSRKNGSQILARMAAKGWLKKLRAGAYQIVPLHASAQSPIENPWAVAMDLFKPAFLSGWTAAEHWDLTEQVFNSVSLVTSRPQHSSLQKVAEVEFRTRTLPVKKMFGHAPIWMGSTKIEMADPHRLLIDILDDPAFGGGGRHTVDIVRAYIRANKYDGNILMDYATRYGKGTVFKRLGFLLEDLHAPVSKEWLEVCRARITKGTSDLDPASPHQGRIVSRWNLRINIPLD